MSLSVHLNHSSQLDEVISALPQDAGRLAVKLENAGDASAANQITAIAHLANIESSCASLDSTVAGSQLQCDIVAELPAGTQTIGSVAPQISFGNESFASDLWVNGTSSASIDMSAHRTLSFAVGLAGAPTGSEYITVEGSHDSGVTWVPVSDYYAQPTGSGAYCISGVLSNPSTADVRFTNYYGSDITTTSAGLTYCRSD